MFRKSLLAMAVVGAGAAQAQTSILEEVVVTATKRESTIQDLPFSINAQTQADIQRSGATNLEELSRNVAGLTIQNLGPGQSQVAIRGVSAGQIVRDQPGVKEQVGVYLDESVVSLSLFTPDFDLYDLARVETLRGPQGTLFGSGSIGGTIRNITEQPKLGVSEAAVEMDFNTVTDGNNGSHLKGMVNVPISDNLAMRVVGYSTQYAGFIDALGENGSRKEDVNTGRRTGGRVALKWTPTDALTITPRLVYQEIQTDGFNRQEAFNLYANPFTTTRPAIDLGEREQFLLLDEAFADETLLADLVVNYEGESFDTTFVASRMERDILVSRDASALTGSVSVDLGFPEQAVALPSNLRDTTDLTQDTLELRFASNSSDDLQWVAGIFYMDIERNYAQRLPTPGYDSFTDAVLGAGTSAAVANGYPSDSPYNADLDYSISQLATFGEVSYAMNEKLTVTAGLRWYDFEEDRTIFGGGLFSDGWDQSDSTASDGINPRLMASYALDESVTLNAQVSQGFRLGGVNDPLNSGLCSPADLETFGGFQDYDDETLWNYEAGVKSRMGNTVINAAVFYTDIENLQTTLDAGSCSSRITFNVPEAHTAGLELEVTTQATEDLALTFAGSLLEAEFDTTVRDGNGAILGGVEEGNRLPSVPEFQMSASATYDLDPIWGSQATFLSATLQYVGTRFTQPSDQLPGAGEFQSGLPFGGATGGEVTSLDLELDSYSMLNLRAGLRYTTWELAAYINNATDENALMSFDRERGGRARLAYRVATPRTIGLTARWFFD
ncbi:MAG: TonB-dependent receptor [Halieaceae bacterium]|jgi:outer membrane receptor protein involved in Fe transport|nr:TonB-dependent receptor [Halieaceae bacterium]